MENLPDLGPVRLDRDGSVLTITLNRPEKLNAISPDMHEAIGAALEFATRCEASQMIVLTGAGKAFCAGGDLAQTCRTVAAFARESEQAKRLVRLMLECEKPIVCRLNGDAIGLGATLVLLCDIVVAAETARIGDPHVRVGLVAGDGGTLIWPAHVGMMAAKYYLMTGDMMTATEARDMGLITFAVEPEELDAKCQSVIRKLSGAAPLAVRWTKRGLNAALQSQAFASFEMSLMTEGLSMLSEDHDEACNAFAEGRKPVFKGQ